MKLKRCSFYPILFMLFIFQSSCESSIKPNAYFSIQKVFMEGKPWIPSENIVSDISVLPQVEIQFDDYINTKSINVGVTLIKVGVPFYPYSLSYKISKDAPNALFTPQQPLEYNTEYQLIFTSWLTSKMGSRLSPNVVIHFRTVEAEKDPTIESVSFLKSDNPLLDKDYSCALTNDTFKVSLPFGTSFTNLIPTIVTKSAFATLRQRSKISADFTSVLSYTVTAQNGLQKVYYVKVSHAPNTENFITSFSFLKSDNSQHLLYDYNGIINNTDSTITVPFPYGTNVSSLIPRLELSENAIVTPVSGVASAFSFTTPTYYTVTSQSNRRKKYSVHLRYEPSNERSISEFKFVSSKNPDLPPGSDFSGTISGTVIKFDLTGRGITREVLARLKPSIKFSIGATISPDTLQSQDFNSVMIYTVTSQFGNSQSYSVSVIN